MTREEALAAIKAIHRPEDQLRDAENEHKEADEVLCQLLRSLGYDDVVDAWEEIYKWYA